MKKINNLELEEFKLEKEGKRLVIEMEAQQLQERLQLERDLKIKEIRLRRRKERLKL